MFRPKTSSSSSPRDTIISTTSNSNTGASNTGSTSTSKTSKLRSHASQLGLSSRASQQQLSNSITHDISGSIPSTFTDGLPLPRLFVFDLDYTLWPFWVDTHVSPPLKSIESGSRVRDGYGEHFAFYEDVGNVLAGIRTTGGGSIKIAAASRTHAPELAREMLKLLRLPTKPVDHLAVQKHKKSAGSNDAGAGANGTATASSNANKEGSTAKALEFFDSLQIFPGSKIGHFKKLRESMGIPFEEMLFFDDESRNKEVEKLGVVMYLVRDGVSNDEVDKGVLSWRKRNRRELK